MKVVIAGAGSVGTAIARDLQQSGHDVLVMEQEPEIAARRRVEYPGVEWVAADEERIAAALEIKAPAGGEGVGQCP